MVNDHYGWLSVHSLKKQKQDALNKSMRSARMIDCSKSTRFSVNLSEIVESPAANLNMDGLAKKVDAKRAKDQEEKAQEKVLNDMFLKTLGEDELVQPLLSSQKKKKRKSSRYARQETQTLHESIQTIQKLKSASTSQCVSPQKFNERDQELAQPEVDAVIPFATEDSKQDGGLSISVIKIVNED